MGAQVDICDTDEVAVQSAQDNFTLNNIDFHEAWIGSAHNTKNQYDVVVANIIADVLVMIHKDLKNRVKAGGILILSGIIDKYLDKVKEKFQDFELIQNLQNKEWHTLILKKDPDVTSQQK